MTRVFFDRELDTVATFWRVFRRDGIALGFITHDRDLWFDGILHRAAPGMIPSSIRKTADLRDDTVEVEGALTHGSISANDLMHGMFDNAAVAIGAVDWETTENAVLYRGRMSGVSQESGGFAAELRSSKSELEVDTVPRTSPTCRAKFCGRGCTLSAERFTHRATIDAVDLDANSATFRDLPDADFEQGELRWLDGPQAGMRFEILKRSGNQLTLDRPLNGAVGAGARAILREGCDHTIATCTTRFANAVNFQGEPFLPGNDFLAQYPVPR